MEQAGVNQIIITPLQNSKSVDPRIFKQKEIILLGILHRYIVMLGVAWSSGYRGHGSFRKIKTPTNTYKVGRVWTGMPFPETISSRKTLYVPTVQLKFERFVRNLTWLSFLLAYLRRLQNSLISSLWNIIIHQEHGVFQFPVCYTKSGSGGKQRFVGITQYLYPHIPKRNILNLIRGIWTVADNYHTGKRTPIFNSSLNKILQSSIKKIFIFCEPNPIL